MQDPRLFQAADVNDVGGPPRIPPKLVSFNDRGRVSVPTRPGASLPTSRTGHQDPDQPGDRSASTAGGPMVAEMKSGLLLLADAPHGSVAFLPSEADVSEAGWALFHSVPETWRSRPQATSGSRLLQKEIAVRLGADPKAINNWETGRSEPRLHFIPGILVFLGYDPLPARKGFGDRLRLVRTARGLSIRSLSELLGVDASTVWGWGAGRHVPVEGSRARLRAILIPLGAAETR